MADSRPRGGRDGKHNTSPKCSPCDRTRCSGRGVLRLLKQPTAKRRPQCNQLKHECLDERLRISGCSDRRGGRPRARLRIAGTCGLLTSLQGQRCIRSFTGTVTPQRYRTRSNTSWSGQPEPAARRSVRSVIAGTSPWAGTRMIARSYRRITIWPIRPIRCRGCMDSRRTHRPVALSFKAELRRHLPIWALATSFTRCRSQVAISSMPRVNPYSIMNLASNEAALRSRRVRNLRGPSSGMVVPDELRSLRTVALVGCRCGWHTARRGPSWQRRPWPGCRRQRRPKQRRRPGPRWRGRPASRQRRWRG
jgi:hypothetical protein